VPRNRATIVIAVGAAVLLVAIVLLWSRGDSGSTAAFCKSLHSGENPLDVFDRYDPADVAAARTQLKQGVDRLRQLEQAAPGEIHGDMKVLVDVAQQLVQALDPSAKNKPLPDFTSQFDRVRASSGNVTRFASDRCAVTLDSSSSSAPVSTGP
jgi:hypothetical protein